MTMSLTQQIVTIAMVVLGTMLTRFLPFVIFPPVNPHRSMFSIWAKCCPQQC